MSFSSYIAYGLFAIGVGLACLSSVPLKKFLLYGSGLVLAVGILCSIKTILIQPTPLPVPSNVSPRSFSPYRQLATLWLGQIVLLGISFIFFYCLEKQTQTNARLYPVKAGYMMELIQQHIFNLGIFPWLFYSILGMGLAYFSLIWGKQPLLSRATLMQGKSKRDFFFFNLLSIVTDTVTIGPYVFVVSLALVWLCETINYAFHWDSLFSMPMRTTFICSLLILFFQKSNKQLIAWMKQYQVSVGQIFMIYILAFAFFISWLHGTSSWITLGQEVSNVTQGTISKSLLTGFYTEASLATRMNLLIWGWWIIWIPWMASLTARSAVGITLIRAFFYSLIIPCLFFGWVIPRLEDYGNKVTLLLDSFSAHAFVAGMLLLFVWVAWKDQRTVGDIGRGLMLPIGRLSKRSLSRWTMIVSLWLSCYIPGWFMLGWLPLQNMVTLGGLFMLIVAAIFIGTWGAFLFRFSASKRYTSLEPL